MVASASAGHASLRARVRPVIFEPYEGQA